ncbi:MAG: hypothetical protein EXR99_02195 [Gemmataceae bacterium]|nr:hypothetical protein [Gemmataceae bacterium]
MKYQVPKIQLIPGADEYLSFQLEGREVLGWNASGRFPRPFFYPVNGPCGKSLTRMGHPAAANHGHHKSLWWGHNSVAGVDFWSEKKSPGNQPKIIQETWHHFQSGNTEAGFAGQIGWFDSHLAKLMTQDLIAFYTPLEGGESWLEIQTRFSTPLAQLTLGKTNFGFIGMRMAQTISAQFGGGILTNSNGEKTEKAVFAKTAHWMDYSGPVSNSSWEGATWMDHPDNPRHPVSWHVRDDGWMSPAFCLTDGLTLAKNDSLSLRYGIWVHAGEVAPEKADEYFKKFAISKPYVLEKSKGPWPMVLTRKN